MNKSHDGYCMSDDNVKRLRKSCLRNTKMSKALSSLELCMQNTRFQNILQKRFRLYVYKIQLRKLYIPQIIPTTILNAISYFMKVAVTDFRSCFQYYTCMAVLSNTTVEFFHNLMTWKYRKEKNKSNFVAKRKMEL